MHVSALMPCFVAFYFFLSPPPPSTVSSHLFASSGQNGGSDKMRVSHWEGRQCKWEFSIDGFQNLLCCAERSERGEAKEERWMEEIADGGGQRGRQSELQSF